MSFFSANHAKSAVERAWLVFTPVWMGIIGGIMVCGWAETWGDWELMVLGVGLALGTFAFPITLWFALPSCVVPLKANEKVASFDKFLEALVPMYAGCVTFSVLLNYFQTPFFFDVLHMRYGFKVTWRIDRNPVFLYGVTVSYFATYSCCACCAFRKWFGLQQHSVARRMMGFVVLPLGLAFTETLLNANPLVERLFCYDDLQLALTFGSLCYSIAFVFTMPVWLWYGGAPETTARPLPKAKAAALAVITNTVAVLLNASVLLTIRLYVAPLVTTVVQDSSPFGGCLKV